jgi:transcriptional regulator with XRE-family HTH domain
MEISQSDLARRSGLHRSYIGDLERGSRNISVRNLSRLAHAMGMQPSKLLALAEKRMSTDPVAPAKGRAVKSKKTVVVKRKVGVKKPKQARKPATRKAGKRTVRAK